MKQIIVLLAFWLTFNGVYGATSLPTPIQPDLTFQTGIATVISSSLTSSGTYTVSYNFMMSTASLNASTGIYSLDYNQKQTKHGFRTKITSLTGTSLQLYVEINNYREPVNILKVSYLVSYSPYLDINYAELTFSGTDALYDSTQPDAGCFITCRQYTNTQSYPTKANPRNGILALSSYEVNDIGGNYTVNDTQPYIGIDLSPSWNANTVSVTITVYGYVEVSFLSFFYIVIEQNVIYDVNHRRAIYGRQAVGCTYHTNGCGTNYPKDTEYKTNAFYVYVDNPYRQQMVFYALDRLIVFWDNTDLAKVAFESGPITRSSTNLIVAVNFTGNLDVFFTLAFSYLSIVNYQCPNIPPMIYYSYNYYQCTDNCGIGYYPNATRYCQPCSSLCYTCSAYTTCTGCHNSQNRVLSGTDCICDVPGGFYDDGTSSVCPPCHYSCATCSGGTSGQCLSCQVAEYRYMNVNTCPCMNGYYDNNASTCDSCHYTCKTGTCTFRWSNRCSSCNTTQHRQILGNFTCGCMAGWYDDSTTSQLCAACLYSCKTCYTTNTNCLSCELSYLRTHNNTDNTCPCSLGYYDSGVVMCQSCYVTCFACNGPAYTNCLSCTSTSTRILNGSICQCPNGKYDSANVCVGCHSECYTCSGGTNNDCTGCSSTNKRVLSNSSCICMNGFYQIGVALCSSCDMACLTCTTTATICTSCHNNSGRYFAGSACLCDVNGYVDVSNDGTCANCHYSCAQCSGTSASSCSQCQSGRVLISGQCLCPTGFYDDGVSISCQPCAPTCVNCTSSLTTACTACNSLYLRSLSSSPIGSCACNSGYYDSGVLLCASCSSPCLTCVSTSSNCSSCDTATNYRVLTSSFTCSCPTGYFQSGSLEVCQPCASPCLNCSTVPTNCTACQPLRTLSSNTCVCASNTYQDASNNCVSCDYTCLTCSGSSTTCTNCYSGVHRTLLGSTCPCDYGYYDTGAMACLQCGYRCQGCSSGTVCDGCPVGSHRTLQANGSCTCDDGYYDDGASSVCLACDGKCVTCQFYSQCLSCDATLNRQWDSLNLLCDCLPIHFDDGVSFACQPCHYSCLTCSDSLSTNCLTCQTTRQLTFPNSCPCKPGFYESSQVCTPCNLSCLTCSSLPTNCTSCHSGSYLSSNQCVCSAGYYLNGLTCSPCSNACQTCDISSTSCTGCNVTQGTILSGSSCVCDTGKYQNGSGVCVICHSYCMTCTGPTQYECQDCHSGVHRTYEPGTTSCPCDSGFYYNGVLLCQACPSPCATCLSGSVLNCTSCLASHQLIGSSCTPIVTCPSNYYYSGQCIASCPNTSYSSANTCLPCENNCLTCISSVVCSSCLTGFYMQSNGSCMGSCPGGSYIWGCGCVTCPTGCAVCAWRSSEGAVVCGQCLGGYYVSGNLCAANCPAQTHILVENRCVGCLSPCLTCTALTASACLSCQPNYIFHNNQCITTCPQGSYLTNGICQYCQITCLTCSSGECQLCIPGYYLNLNGNCIPQTYFVGESGELVTCHPNCLTCTDASFSSCISCAQYRGNYAQMAVSGYCECWQDTIDLGNGTCSLNSYKQLQQTTETLISSSTAVTYGCMLTGLISLNMVGSIFALYYQQEYGNLYYLNASAVAQTDLVLQHYRHNSPNTFLKDSRKDRSQRQMQEQSVRSLEYFSNVQQIQSLFMRGQQWEYLCMWGLLILIVVCVLWILVGGLTYVSEKLKEKERQGCVVCSRAVSKILAFLKQSCIILVHLMTINQVTMYGFASFKIILSQHVDLNIFKLILSGLFLSYYPLYLIRLLISMARYEGRTDQNSKFMLLFACLQSSRKRSTLSRLYIPLLMVRSLLISMALVFLSANAKGQIATVLALFLLWCIYSFCCCPYYFYIRVFIRIYELLFAVQLSLLTISTLKPEYSRVNPAVGLLVLNYLQLANFIALSITIFMAAFYKLKCFNRSDSSIANTGIENNVSVMKLTETMGNMDEGENKQIGNFQTLMRDRMAGEMCQTEEDNISVRRPKYVSTIVDGKEQSLPSTVKNSLTVPKNILSLSKQEPSQRSHIDQDWTQIKRKKYRVKRQPKKTCEFDDR